jgi:hypothetical protein
VNKRPAEAVAGMETRHWDVHQFNPSAHHKRPRDVETISTEACTTVNEYSNHLRERETPDEHEWKRQRHSSQPNASIWDTSVQTSLWLAQQNSLAPTASMSREDERQSCQANESEQSISRDDESLNRASSWACGGGYIETAHGQEGRGLGTQNLSSLANASELTRTEKWLLEAISDH